MALPEGLLSSVKNYLDITWVDDAGDLKLSGIIARGIVYINRIAGVDFDYTIESDERQLLFDYCRYIRSGALEDFKNNFKSELISLQLREEVKAYAEESADV